VYRYVLDHVPADVRKQSAADIAESLETFGRDTGSTAAWSLLPIILLDPDFGVVSTGSLAFAELMPIEEDNPMTGPLQLLAIACDPSVAPERRAAMLTGLASLGDSRVLDLLEAHWDDLDGDAAADLVKGLGALPPTVAVIEFLVSCLERWLADGHEGPIGHVVPALVKLASSAKRPAPNAEASGVLDIERTLPTWTVPEGTNPVVIRSSYTVSEFGARIVPRLARMGASETYPRLLPMAIRAWNGDDCILLDSLTQTIARYAIVDGASEVLDTPPDLDPIPDWDRGDCILEWGILNPFGPTRVQWCLVELATDRHALVYTMHHPIAPVAKLVAITTAASPALLARIFEQVARAGALSGDPLLKALPHWVKVNGPLAESFDGGRFFGRLHRAAIGHGSPEGADVKRAIRELKRLADNPRAEIARQLGDAATLVSHTLSVAKKEGAGKALSALARTRIREVVGRDTDYARWFAVASDPDRVAAVAPHFLACWSAASRFSAV
jgi:hypothetical protein